MFNFSHVWPCLWKWRNMYCTKYLWLSWKIFGQPMSTRYVLGFCTMNTFINYVCLSDMWKMLCNPWTAGAKVFSMKFINFWVMHMHVYYYNIQPHIMCEGRCISCILFHQLLKTIFQKWYLPLPLLIFQLDFHLLTRDILREYCSNIPHTFSTAEPSKGPEKANNRLNASWNKTRCKAASFFFFSLRLP